MHSIYSFWKDMVNKKDAFSNLSVLMSFPFDLKAFSSTHRRGFPNFSIKTNRNKSLFTGGELIKLKNRNDYSIAPFKSLIPSGKVNINSLSDFQRQLRDAGDDLNSLQDRDVYFLVRGRKGHHQKICLVHGSFFETIDEKELIRQSFVEPMKEKFSAIFESVQVQQYLDALVLERGDFSRSPNIENASIKFRFKVTAEVKPEGNILNSKMYPEILDDTLNFLVPYHTEEEKADVISKANLVMGQREMKRINVFAIKHPLNGWFVVFQVNL